MAWLKRVLRLIYRFSWRSPYYRLRAGVKPEIFGPLTLLMTRSFDTTGGKQIYVFLRLMRSRQFRMFGSLIRSLSDSLVPSAGNISISCFPGTRTTVSENSLNSSTITIAIGLTIH